MRWRSFTCPVAILAVLSAAAPPAAARYDERDASRDCERAIVDAYGHQEFYDERSRDTGNDSYEFSGRVRVRDGGDRSFSCRIRHREVVSYKLHGSSHDHHGGGNEGISTGTAAAIGAGALGLVALAAIASAGGQDDHDRRRAAGQSDPNAYPLADRGYLEEECRRNLVGHLQQDHGSVDRLTMAQPYLDGRSLRGEGDVQFRVGGGRRLSFACEFDRQGRIHDGSYRYY